MENTLVCLYYHVLTRPDKGTHWLPRHNHVVVAASSPHAPPPSAMGSVTPDAGNRSTPFHNGTNPGNRPTPARNGLPSSRAEWGADHLHHALGTTTYCFKRKNNFPGPGMKVALLVPLAVVTV